MKKTLTSIGILSAALVLNGCGTTTSAKDDIIPQSEFTTEEIYDMHTGGGTGGQEHSRYRINKRYATESEILTQPYETHDVRKPVFKKLPNPTLYIYFPAKVSTTDRMPIPAWMTEFSMYDRDEYAQYGEVPLEVEK